MGIIVSKRTFSGDSLAEWTVAHGLEARFEKNCLVVSDVSEQNWHLLRIESDEFVFRKIVMKCVLQKLPSTSTNFYIHHFGALNIAEVDFEGNVIDRGISEALMVALNPEKQIMEVEAAFLNCHPSISFGCSKNGSPVYFGDGAAQYAIIRVDVEVFDASQELSSVEQRDRITLVDVGAQEGLQLEWALKAPFLNPVMFEPIPREAEKLRKVVSRLPGALVMETALADVKGQQILHLTVASGCSSLLEPNKSAIEHYSIAWIFDVINKQKVLCQRYDELYFERAVPAPDVIKIDVQGFEYEVLLGFGHLLEGVLGIELEAHFYQLYSSQKLLGEIVSYLNGYGLVLRELREQPNFDGDLVEVNAFFTRRRKEVSQLSPSQKAKFDLLTDVWKLKSYAYA